MFSIRDKNYLATNRTMEYDIFELDLKTKVKGMDLLCGDVNDSYFRISICGQFYDYVILEDAHHDYIGIFNGKYIEMDISDQCSPPRKSNHFKNITIHNHFQNGLISEIIANKESYVFFAFQYKCYIHDIKTGIMLANWNPELEIEFVQLSPSRNKILITAQDELYVFDLKYVAKHILNYRKISNHKKYKINIIPKVHCQWINDDIIFMYEYFGTIVHCSIYNLLFDLCVDFSMDDYFLPYLVNGVFYIFQNHVIVVINGTTVDYIPNEFKIMHYNPYTDIFINDQLDIFILNNGNFVPFKEVYYDHSLAPKLIRTIMSFFGNCELFDELPNEIIHQIYLQLLQLEYYMPFGLPTL